jgi:hypothetical protein
MRRTIGASVLAIVFATLMPSSAQDKGKGEETPAAVEMTPLKVSVTFTEYEGDKKVKSLPYTLVVLADSKGPKSVVKMGSRVPVYTGKENGMQYLDVGSNIDCVAFRVKDGEFDLRLKLDRSWIEGDVSVPVEKSGSSQSSGTFPEPIVRQFTSEQSLKLRDGQSVESMFATDPLSGKVFKGEVTLNILK